MLLVLKARLHETDSIDVRIPLRDSDPLGSLYDFLLKEFDIAPSYIKLYDNGELIEATDEVLWNAAEKEDCIDIITPESIVYVSLNWAEGIVTVCVPGTITLEEVIGAVLQIVHIDENELFLSGCRLTDMDPSISVFGANVGSITCPDGFVEDPESEEDDCVNTYMHPCRYSFPGGTALNKYTLISTQHSLHLYQPVTLPCDYLTGEAAELKDAPIEKNWKKYLRLMPTSGLIGYSGDIHYNNLTSSKRVHRENLPIITLPHTPETTIGIRRFSTRGYGSTFSSQESNITHSDDDSQGLLSDRPSAYMDPLVPAEMMESMLSPSVAAREGRESFIRYGLNDMTLTVSSSQVMTDLSTQSTVNGTPTTPTTDSKHIMISTGHRASIRRVQNDGKAVTYRETACTANNDLKPRESFFSWFTSEQSPTLSEGSSVYYSFNSFENMLRCNSDSVSEEELNQIVYEYRICRQREGDVFLDYLRNSPYLRNLAGLTFRFVSSSVFDKLLNILMEVVKNNSILLQSVSQWIGMGTIINYLKLTESTSVDRIVVFLHFIYELIQDFYVANDFYEMKGLEALIEINYCSGSKNVRNNTMSILKWLMLNGDVRIVNSSYHAALQIFQRDDTIIVSLLTELNSRIKDSNGYNVSEVLRNDVLSIRMFYPNDPAIQSLCISYLSYYEPKCKCSVLYHV